MGASKKIMLVGEPMALFLADELGKLENVSHFHTGIAGAELNVAIGLSRLEHPVSYLTKVGNDPFGRKVVHTLEENGIDTSLVCTSEERPTGFMLKQKVLKGDPGIFYFRKNSAASTLSCEDIDHIDFSQYCGVHMTGIFPALSAETRRAAVYLMQKAKKAGLFVSFDPNLRPQLWNSREEMKAVINQLAVMADLFLPGYKEGEILMGSREPKQIAEYYLSKGVKTIVIKTGSKGAYGATVKEALSCPTYQETAVVDTVGAGDGFAAGVLSALAEELPLKEMMLRGNAIGTLQIENAGDNEGLPTRAKLKDFMDHTPLHTDKV
jgi:2-dehydro-3-deoxygluconokinase